MPVFCSLLTVSMIGVSSLLLLSNQDGPLLRGSVRTGPCCSQYALSLSIQKPDRSG